MADTLAVLVSEARKGKYSLIKDLCSEDVLRVWDGLSKIVQSNMLLIKGVSIHGFGTFTFSQRRVDVGGNRFIMLQRPVLVMSENLLKTHSLTYPKQHATGQVPVVKLNYTVLSNNTGLDRDVVELCVCDIFRAFSRSLANGRNIDFDFSGVGRLVIREKKARMKFFKEFIKAMDVSGTLKSAFRPGSRPGTDGSIISGPSRSTLRPVTCEFLSLPRIMETSEDNDDQLTVVCHLPQSLTKESDPPKHTKIVPIASPSLRRPETPFHTPKPISALSFIKSIDTKEAEDVTVASMCTRPSTCSHSSTGHDLCYLCHQRAINNVPISISKEKRERERIQEQLLQRFQHQKDRLEIEKEQSNLLRRKQIEQETAGFNLRSSEIKKLKEREDLMKSFEPDPSYLFRHRSITPCYTMKQIEYCKQLDEQVKRRRTAMNKIKLDEECIEKKEQEELKKQLELIENEYTKAAAEKKFKYLQGLNDQIFPQNEVQKLRNVGEVLGMHATNSESHSPLHETTVTSCCFEPCCKKERSFCPINISKTTVSPFLQFDEQKKSAVKTPNQIMVQSNNESKVRSPSPIYQPVFGVHDISPQKLKTEKERAKSLYNEQVSEATQMKERKKLADLKKKEEEAKQLKMNKEDLLNDIRLSLEEKVSFRKDLENCWFEAKQEKQHCNTAGTFQEYMLLQEQCKKYLRCRQCQRKRENKGTSNVLSESRYISGSRLMI